MDPWERLRNPEFLTRLASYINFDHLAKSLVKEDILTTTTAEDIKEKVELEERNLCLLQCLPRGEPAMYDVFVFLLHEKEMHAAVWLLKAEADVLPELLRAPPQPSGSQRGLQAFGGSGARLPDDGTVADSGAHRTVGEASSAEQQVAKSTRLKRGDNTYPMVHSPRGKCIIINNRDFGGLLATRHGSDVDVHRMKRLFSAFLFDCEVHRNLTAKEMEEVLEAVAKPDQQQGADCLVVVLMSHGDRDVVFGTDGEKLCLYDKVYPLFNNDKCPALQGKPKLFFVQACRGDKDDNGTYGKHTSPDALPLGPSPQFEASATKVVLDPRMASFSDMYVVYATIPGYKALKNEVTGSWLLSAVYNVFSKYACRMHLEGMMHLVHRELLGRPAHDGARVTPCTELYGWTKWLYFNPGVFEGEKRNQRKRLRRPTPARGYAGKAGEA